ncbi:MAG: alginate export family protein [Acidobacteria bacterium]|nr:alginate export family protein [Acidobacteriota bacterium]
MMRFAIRCRTFHFFAAALAGAAGTAPLAAQSPPPPSVQSPPPPSAPATLVLRNATRVEMWSYFEPQPGGGNPDYTNIANRLQLGVERRRPKYEMTATLQYVQFGGLPPDATGPGPLGTGALYFDQGGRTPASRQFYLRYLNLKLNNLAPGWSLRLGRMGYASGAESPSGDESLEAIKRQRIDSRLLGEFEWSLYQRGFDGLRTDLDRSRWHASLALLRPTQGGFEDEAGSEIRDIDLWAATASSKPGGLIPHTDWQVFAIGYDDERDVRQRPDNSGLVPARIDVNVTTMGTSMVAAYRRQDGVRLDGVAWFAGQTGDWFGQTHRASAIDVEAGAQFMRTAWKPWIRGGYARASGDADPRDLRHTTFFPVLPTARKYALSATYSFMNLQDVFVQFLAAPRPTLSLRVDAHALDLANPGDRWYFGSGAGQDTGASFGYGSRASQGAVDFGTVVEGSADYRVSPHWSINGYLGTIRGGDVVRRTFRGSTLVFGYVENVVQF